MQGLVKYGKKWFGKMDDNASPNTAPKVSIVIPAFNAERFIQATLQSILAQDFTDFEIIVVDDGSTDHTKDIVTATPQARYHFQTNQGPAAARNTGLNLAQGEYIAFVDADDRWHPRMLSSCVQILEANRDVGAVHAKWVVIDEDGKVVQVHTEWRPWRGNIFERLIVEIVFNTTSVVWRRRLWEEIGGFDLSPEMNDDWLNWLRIAYRGTVFECIDEPLVYVRKHATNLTKQQNSRVIRWRQNALDRILTELPVAQEIADLAYAKVYWIATIDALSRNDGERARKEFRDALKHDPLLLEYRSTYFDAAMATCNGRLNVPRTFSVTYAANSISMLLSSAFQSPKLSRLPLKKNQAQALGFLCIAQVVYSYHEWRVANSSWVFYYLLRTLISSPVYALKIGCPKWMIRTVLGRPLLLKLRFWLTGRPVDDKARIG